MRSKAERLRSGRGARALRLRSGRGARALRPLLAMLTLLVASCQHAAPPPPPKPKVVVSHPLDREVEEWDEYTARLEAKDFVEIRARVSGYLQSIHFKDGAIVPKGEVLFQIDPRPYEAILHRAEGDVAVAKARLQLARTKLERATKLVGREAISQEEADTRAAEARQAEAALEGSAAAVDAAKLDVEFTTIRAPISGRASRKLVTEGNLITGGAGSQGTLLTTIVSLDPIYVYFEADERAFLKYQRLAQTGERPSSRDVNNPVRIGLADEEGYPHEGYMDFVDNQLDPGTGTMIGRAVLPNPYFTLTPGLFARLRLPGRPRYRGLLVPEEAIVSDQSRKIVYVVDDQGVAHDRVVSLGSMYGGLRIVQDGLTSGDRIVVSGVQRVRPGIAVETSDRPPAEPRGVTDSSDDGEQRGDEAAPEPSATPAAARSDGAHAAASPAGNPEGRNP
jgi:RND family efflux transporter MFP subunit